MSDLQIYRALREQFRSIDGNADALAKKCETFAQAKQLSDEWAQAQRNYVEARNRIFDSNAAKVKELYEQLGEAQKKIDGSLKDLKKVGSILDKIGDAVRIGTSLVALGRSA
jgi:DNA repair exonuclease SbcCD ATPase subunit